MDGVIIIDKPKGCTSHDVVFKVRKILGTKKVGHAGTLDPMATGVLPVLVGKATKVSKYLIEHNKEYTATIKLGEKTDTGDGEGNCIETKAVSENCFDTNNVTTVLKEMLGKQMQVPPMYSAIKVNGKKLYEYAREGIEVEVDAREIEIYNMNLIDINKEEKTITFSVACSKGTYIRTVCETIAEKLGTCGYMKELRRNVVSDFSIDNAVSLETLEEHKTDIEFLNKNIINIEELFGKKDKIILNDSKINHFLNGVQLTQKYEDDLYRVYDTKGNFIGLGIIKNELLKRDVIL